VFEALANTLTRVFERLRGYGRLTEPNIREAMREIRMALLEADVNYAVARDFVARVSEQCVGEQVLESITPGQQVVKRVHDELVKLLSEGAPRALDLGGRPATVMLVGLHGSGKTTTAAKLAALWKNEGRRVLLAAADIRRPAAVEQLTLLGRQGGVDVLPPHPGEAVPALGARALETARTGLYDTLLVDTGGRFQIDAELVQELKDLQAAVNSRNILLVVDAAIGQESVHVAEVFHKDLGLTGLILTKLDGDARGGAALSIQAVTRCPILYTGTGEKLANLEPFHPERMASRLLGMGDVVSLVEKVQATVDARQAEEMERKLRTNRLDLEDFLEQMGQFRKLGPIENLLEMLPMGSKGLAQAKDGQNAGRDFEQFTRRAEAIIRSMTPQERRRPELLNASRRRRIAKGSGTQVSDVNDLLRQFEQARKMAKRMRELQKRLQKSR